MGPIDSPRTSSTSDKPDAAPDPAESMVPKESRHADDDRSSEISPKTEVMPLPLTDSAAYLPEASHTGEKSDPDSDPFLDTTSGAKPRSNLFQSYEANLRWRAPSGPPPIQLLPSSKEDNDRTKGSSSRFPSQRRTSLSSSPGLKPNTHHARAMSAPPPVSGTIQKAPFGLQPGKLSPEVNKALEDLGIGRNSDAAHTVETPESPRPHGPGLWLFRKYESREEGITTDQKQDILADVLPSNSKSSSIQPAGVDGNPAILVEQASDGEDPSKVQSAPMTLPLQTTQPREDRHEPLEKALESASSSATPLDPEQISQNNSARKIRRIRKRRYDSSMSSPAAITPLGTSPGPFLHYTPVSYAQWQQSSSKDFDAVKSELGSEMQTPHQRSSDLTAFTGDSEKKTEGRAMDELQHSDSLEAESMIDRLLGLKYFEGAQSFLDQLSLILRLLQQRDLRSSAKALLAAQKEKAHVQPSMSASATVTEKLHSGKCDESATAGPDFRIDKPVDKDLGRRSSNPQDPRRSSLFPLPSSSRGRSASESAIPTRAKIFSDVPAVLIDVDTIVRYTPSKKDGKIEVSIDFIAPVGNITLKKFTSWQLPKKYERTTLPEHLQQEIQRPIQRNVQVGKPHHGKIYIYWVQGNFGLVKIGFTTLTVEKRLQKWHSDCRHTPHPVDLNKAYLDGLPHVHRIERLIHIELRDQRVVEPVCAGCDKPHDEWFIVTNELAKQVTHKWCDWMQQEPYEKIDETPYKSSGGEERVKEKWTLKQEHVDSLKGKSSRRSSLLDPVPAPASAPPKLPSRPSRLAPSPRPRIRESLSAGPLSGSTPDEKIDGSFEGRTTAAISSNLLSPAHTPTPSEGRYNFRNTPERERRRRSASQLT